MKSTGNSIPSIQNSDQSTKVENNKKNYTCPITLSIFFKPAMLDCGNEHFVEEEMGKTLLKEMKPCCPTCRQPIRNVTPSQHMKRMVEDFLGEHPEFVKERYQPEVVIADVKQNSNAAASSFDPFEPSVTEEEMKQQHIILQQAQNGRQQQATQQNSASLNPMHYAVASGSIMAMLYTNNLLRIYGSDINHIALAAATSGSQNYFQNANESKQIISATQSASSESKSSSLSHSMFSSTANGTQTRAPNSNQGTELIKTLIIGDVSAAKSQFVMRFVDEGPFSYISTLGVDFKIKSLPVNNINCKLQIWDTAGQEGLLHITNSYYRSTSAIIMMYSVNDMESFNNIREWYANIDAHQNLNAIVYLVGNDPAGAESKRVVSQAQGQALANELGVKFFECSSRNNINIHEIFNSLCVDVLAKRTPANNNASQAITEKAKCLIM